MGDVSIKVGIGEAQRFDGPDGRLVSQRWRIHAIPRRDRAVTMRGIAVLKGRLLCGKCRATAKWFQAEHYSAPRSGRERGG